MAHREQTTFQFFWQDRRVHKEFGAGVSLHSHTMYSEESLEMLPRYTGRVPVVRHALDRSVDYTRAFWTPPLSPRQALRLEEKQIQRQFRLPALVSLTDHDNIKAGSLLRVMANYGHVPISTEWTIPFGPTFFHIGVHNLPASEAAGIMQELSAYTAEPEPDRLISNLARLNSHPDLLLVLNHPLWDEKGIGLAQHRETLRNLLKLCGCQFHALELNGLRSWHENQQVIRLAWEMDLPLTGGGDRHGREPNSILNLSRGTNLIEFVHELRYQRRSHLVFMPQYHEPLTLRTIQTVIDILRDYPEVFEGRRTWPERVFYRAPDSATAVPISAIWPNGNEPRIFRAVTFATRLAQTWGVQSALRLLFRDRDLWRSASSDLPSFRSLEMDGKAAI